MHSIYIQVSWTLKFVKSDTCLLPGISGEGYSTCTSNRWWSNRHLSGWVLECTIVCKYITPATLILGRKGLINSYTGNEEVLNREVAQGIRNQRWSPPQSKTQTSFILWSLLAPLSCALHPSWWGPQGLSSERSSPLTPPGQTTALVKAHAIWKELTPGREYWFLPRIS